MKFLILLFSYLPYEGYFVLLMLLSAIYFLLIAPMIFCILIIPRIENRYRTSLRVRDEDYFVMFPNWGMPAFEMSFHIFCKYMKWDSLLLKKRANGTFLSKMQMINYDINTACRSEIIISCISVFFFFAAIISAIIVALKC